jgi:hypothetical protein
MIEPMSAKRPYVPSNQERGEGAGSQRGPARKGLRRPFVPGAETSPQDPPVSDPSRADPEPPAGGGQYIEINLDELIGPGEVPSALTETPPPTGPKPEPASDSTLVYGVAEELVRMRRQLELRGSESRILIELQREADSPTMRELIEAAFAAGYFAAKGELERRIGRAR